MPPHLARRIIAHITTPAVVGLVLAALWSESLREFIADYGMITFACYVGWLLIGLPGLLANPRKAVPQLTKHIAVGAALGALPGLFIVLLSLRADDFLEMAKLSLVGAAIGILAAGWYWFCAYWSPRQPST